MNKYLRYSFSIVCLSAIFGCDGIEPKKQAQSTDISPTITSISSVSHPVTNSQTQQSISLYSANKEYLSAKSPVPVVPLAVTKEEIALREQQIKVAEKIQLNARANSEAGVADKNEVEMATNLILSNKIKLLQAKELLRLKQQQKENKKAMN